MGDAYSGQAGEKKQGSGLSGDFDLIVVGGGFAGLVAARTAAMRGLRVAVLEKKTDPGAGVHTTGILVKEAANSLDLPVELSRKIRGVRLYSPSMAELDLDSPGYYFLATDTPGLLRWLAREAGLAGAELSFGTAFKGARRAGGRILIEGLGVSTRYLIGADGAKSQVAKVFGLGRNSRFLLGLELEYEGHCGLDPSRLHCFLDRVLAPGYIAWAVPGVGITQLGLAHELPHKTDLAALASKAALVGRFMSARQVGRRGGLIPVGGLVQPFASDGVLLIGDAAGTVSPATAGGIHNAFCYGRRAAQAVCDFLQDQGPEPSRVLALELPKYPLKSLMRGVLRHGPPDWAFNLAIQTAPMKALARQIYFHHRGPGLGWCHRRYFKPALEEG